MKSRKNNSSEKRMLERLENSQKLVEEVQKYKDFKFDNIFLTDESSVDKKNSTFVLAIKQNEKL
jgi:ribosome assembly protein YihI (activator of Der GTPase)